MISVVGSCFLAKLWMHDSCWKFGQVLTLDSHSDTTFCTGIFGVSEEAQFCHGWSVLTGAAHVGNGFPGTGGFQRALTRREKNIVGPLFCGGLPPAGTFLDED